MEFFYWDYNIVLPYSPWCYHYTTEFGRLFMLAHYLSANDEMTTDASWMQQKRVYLPFGGWVGTWCHLRRRHFTPLLNATLASAAQDTLWLEFSLTSCSSPWPRPPPRWPSGEPPDLSMSPCHVVIYITPLFSSGSMQQDLMILFILCIIFSYVQYSNIAARVVRRALKPELQGDAAKREAASIKFRKWVDGKPEGNETRLKSHPKISKHWLSNQTAYC